MVAQPFNFSRQVPGQPELHIETLSQKKTQKTKVLYAGNNSYVQVIRLTKIKIRTNYQSSCLQASGGDLDTVLQNPFFTNLTYCSTSHSMFSAPRYSFGISNVHHSRCPSAPK